MCLFIVELSSEIFIAVVKRYVSIVVKNIFTDIFFIKLLLYLLSFQSLWLFHFSVWNTGFSIMFSSVYGHEFFKGYFYNGIFLSPLTIPDHFGRYSSLGWWS